MKSKNLNLKKLSNYDEGGGCGWIESCRWMRAMQVDEKNPVDEWRGIVVDKWNPLMNEGGGVVVEQ